MQSKPCRVLERWLTQGAVDDPFSEFMVCEQLVRFRYLASSATPHQCPCV